MRISTSSRTAHARHAAGAGLTRPILGAFAVVLVVVMAMFAIQLAGGRGQSESADAARHAEEVLKVSNALERRVIDIETGLRGFLLTRQEQYLDSYVKARAEFPTQLARLRALTRVPAQARRARELAGLVGVYVGAYAAPLRQEGLALSRGDVDTATALGKLKVDAMRERFAVFNAAEERLASSRRGRARAAARASSVMAGAGLGVSAALLLGLAAYLAESVRVFGADTARDDMAVLVIRCTGTAQSEVAAPALDQVARV